MAVTTINVGTPNGGNGDNLRDAFVKTNANFDILSTTSKLSNGDLEVNGIRLGKGNNNIYDSTALGFGALNNQSLGALVFSNTAIGYSSLTNNSTGFMNTAVGTNSLANTTIGGNNVAVGVNALLSNISGSANVSVGGQSMEFNSYGDNNTAVGTGSLRNNTEGDYNTSIGRGTLALNSQGNYNVAVGAVALSKNTIGISNVSIGTGSMTDITDGSNNTAIGVDALDVGNWNNATAIGYTAQVPNNNTMRLGNTSVTAVVSQVGSWSDERDKTEIRDTVLGLDFVNSLRAVDYKWDYREDYKTEKPSKLNENATEEEKVAHKILMDEWVESCKLSNLVHDGTHTRNRFHHGLIAQELKEVIETSGVDFGGFQDNSLNGGDDLMTVSYIELIAPMIKAIQELTARINVLEGN